MRRSEMLFNQKNKPTERFAHFLFDVDVPGADLENINKALQTRFFQKNEDGTSKERWELENIEVGCPFEKFIRHLRLCGFIAETIPQKWEYKRAAWPGALAVRAAIRLLDLANAWKSGVCWKELIVFGGKRNIQPDKEDFSHIKEAFGIEIGSSRLLLFWQTNKPQTELEMMQFGWKYSPHIPKKMRDIPVVFVDAPMKPPTKEGNPPVRPNTEDTILHWLNNVKPNPGSMLLSSGAPYGMAQDEAFWMLLGPHGHTVETFGHAAPNLPIETFMREVAGCVNRIYRARFK